MNALKGLSVVVAGAGAIGSVTALVIARLGADVVLADPASQGANASGIAAGMLAPTSEALLDPISSDHHALFMWARDAWPALMDGLQGPVIDRSGAVLLHADAAELQTKARLIGAALDVLAPSTARRIAPGLSTAQPVLFSPDDWRIEPPALLEALHAALSGLGGRRVRGAVVAFADGRVALDDGEQLPADALILATGWTPGSLQPIKGQILRFPGFGPPRGPVVRGEGVYAAPSAGGLIVGASMEEGRSDQTIDAAVVARLREGAERLYPDLVGSPLVAAAGVRAATPDGLPLVGTGAAPGVFLAQGARRNGWLLAPLIAQTLVDLLAGRAPATLAFDPARFAAAKA